MTDDKKNGMCISDDGECELDYKKVTEDDELDNKTKIVTILNKKWDKPYIWMIINFVHLMAIILTFVLLTLNNNYFLIVSILLTIGFIFDFIGTYYIYLVYPKQFVHVELNSFLNNSKNEYILLWRCLLIFLIFYLGLSILYIFTIKILILWIMIFMAGGKFAASTLNLKQILLFYYKN